ncbi:MAG: hypothetical protein OEZ39_00315 [Gammaproteobacteria bacterium]|nr:hypothetical protein [Gammaproteobacteria bacterium]MDH5650291.1 hypothetical protein [Gammaproteobacteria bacterium]
MNNIKSVAIVLLVSLLAGCAVTATNTYQAAGKTLLCEPGRKLGKVVVLPEAVWRKDQKESEIRKIMALVELEKAFTSLPCGSMDSPGGLKGFDNWSDMPESVLVKHFTDEGADTIILIRIEELTPRLEITWSLPFLWSGSSEADFRVRAIDTKSGAILTDMRIKRSRGGPFNIRPADWAQQEFAAALQAVIGP